MSLVEGDDRAALPSMSWNSVVPKGAAQNKAPVPIEPVEIAPLTPATAEPDAMFTLSLDDPAPPVERPAVPSNPDVPISLSMGDLGPVSVSAPSKPVAPAAFDMSLSKAAPTPTPTPTPAAFDMSLSKAAPTPTPATPPTPARVEIALAIPPIAATPKVVQQPAQLPSRPASIQVVEPAPAPVVEPAPVQQPVPVVEPAPVQVVEHAPQPVPVVEPVQVATLPTHAQVRPVVAPNASNSPLAIDPIETSNRRRRKQRKDRTSGIARLGFVLLLVGALASAGVVFGSSYLFPSKWDETVLPYSEPVASVRGVDFTEPITITALPAADHRDLVLEQVFGTLDENVATWRALGLAGAEGTDDTTLRNLTEKYAPVIYSTQDGQIYYDEAYDSGDRESRVMQATAVASLDQDFTFSTSAVDRGLDDNSLVDAHVVQQSALIQQASTVNALVDPTEIATFAFLPPVLDYQLAAPVVLADLLPAFDEVAPNPLSDMSLGGPGPLPSTSLTLLTRTSLVVGDQPVGDTQAMDRGFWFLVFATHLDAVTSYDMSKLIEQAGLQAVTTTQGTCAVATFGAGNAAANAELTARLAMWVEATAPEMGAAVGALPDSSVQLRSCEPSGPYTSNARFGVSRQLLGWRAAELAVTTAMLEQGGTEADLKSALAGLADRPEVLALVDLPAGTPAADTAAAARAAATLIVEQQLGATDAALPADG
jgi:hypothetical protein